MAARVHIRSAADSLRALAAERGWPLSADDVWDAAEACLTAHEVHGWIPRCDNEVSLWEGLEQEDSLANYRAELDSGYETTKRAFG